MPFRAPVHRPPGAPKPGEAKYAYEKWRGNASARGYGADWKKVRKLVLAQEPLCRPCSE